MRTAAIVLAAGRSSRYRAAGGQASTKLVDLYGGVPLVRHAVEAALAARATPVVVVTGHAQADVQAVLQDLPIRFAHNPDYATGLASSLRTGLQALGPAVDGALVLLGDMPLVDAATLVALMAAAEAAPGAHAAVPVAEGVRGNPVLLRRPLFARAALLSGDEGARRLLRDPAVAVREVAFTGAAVRLDVDVPGAGGRAD